MKYKHSIRKIDMLGRVVIPSQLRDALGMDINSLVVLRAENNDVVIRKFGARCLLCGAQDELVQFRGKPVCRSCLGAAVDLSGGVGSL